MKNSLLLAVLPCLALSACAPDVVIAGFVHGPVDAELTLQNNGGDDLEVTVVRAGAQTDDYDVTGFAFATPLGEGEPYAVTVLTAPEGQVCQVFEAATGLAQENLEVRVGCEWEQDHVSRSSDDSVLGTFFDSTEPAVGGDAELGEGRFVAFVSSAAMDGASGAHRQVFFRDRLTGQTQLVSARAGAEGNGDSVAPAMASSGLFVAFESDADNLVDNDANGVRDIFVWSAEAPNAGVQRVSVGGDGAEANGPCGQPSLSADGSVVAFTSSASTLSGGVDGINTVNVYRRDLASGATQLVSFDGGGTGGGGAHPMLSDDGDRLVFYSASSAIVPNDANGLWDIFVWNNSAGTHKRVSLTASGAERDQGSESASRVVAPAISGDGRFVAFATTANSMVQGDANDSQDVFVVELDSGGVTRASDGAGGVDSDGDSPIGQGERVSLSADGGLVTFTTLATNLTAEPGNVVIRDLRSGGTQVVSAQTGPGVGPPVMSFAGAYVVFGSNTELDGRFDATGLFARFTGLSRAWWWFVD